jgi:hypothetical protein
MPFDLVNNHIYLSVRVNRSEPFTYVLDTGAGCSSVNRQRAEELHLKKRVWQLKVEGWSGWGEARLLRGVTFDLDGLKHSPRWVTALTLPGDWLNPMDGLLGYDLFKRFVVEIDFKACKIRLYEPHRYAYEGSGAILPIQLRHRVPYVQASVFGANETPIQGRFLIDSGCGDALSLGEPVVRTNRLIETAERVVRITSGGIGGAFPTLQGHVPKFQLGPYLLDRPTAEFLLHPMVAVDKQTGTIGVGLLKRFKVVFDYSRRRVILEPNADFAKPFELRWSGSVIKVANDGFHLWVSGAELVAHAPEFDTCRVDKIKKGSPADQAGLRVNDLVRTFDGQPVSALNLEQWMNFVGQAGRFCRVQLQRGQEQITTQLKLDWLCFWDRD